ncbi:MAG TPA: bifunctional acetate--CoA ligase family protein/GNAT family N-acetyltransferase [Xanthobacteraceae bacterium]|nr:bifunctional acetate--CoA ligase family protein/GNAT family N-acetyltransferase [Xanthobacteraceae bacterium]
MTVRNLDALFRPKAIALVGASNQANSVGAVLARNLFEGGFRGPIMPVNPHERAIRSAVNYRSVSELPMTPDLAVLSTPPATVPSLIAELGARGCRAAVVVSAGFGEADRAGGRELQQRMLDAAKPHLLRIIGPNCLGFLSPPCGINASFAHLTPAAGSLAFVTQSGAVATSVLEWARHRNIGFSHIVSLGDMSDVDFGDLLDYLALDGETRAILLYIESITHARKFMSAGRIAARTKPIVVVKAGRSEAGARAALSHTGALAGSDAVHDAAFARAGMLRVAALRELFEAAATLSAGMRVNGDRLAILTNGGGIGVLATDAVAHYGGRLATLSPETLAKLDRLLPATWSHGNPVDILGDAGPDRYAGALVALLEDPALDAILVLNCPTGVADSTAAAQAVTTALPPRPRVPILTSWLGDTANATALFAARKLPTYEAPEAAVRAFMHLVRYRRNQELLMQTPPSATHVVPQDRSAATRLVTGALADGRSVLTEPEAKAVLAAYGIPVVPTLTAAGPQEAGEVAVRLGFPVVLKILSPDITHKSDIGGVHLDLRSADAVREAAQAMLAAARAKAPGARIEGFTVQPMVQRPSAHELIAGIGADTVFGPVMLFGHGGVAVEVIGDRAVALPPLNLVLARDMIDRTRVARMLRGYRDRPAADLEAIAATMVKLSQLCVDLPAVTELDINPLLADGAGVLALDARIVVSRERRHPGLAIRPYPSALEHEITTRSGRRFHVRPMRPEDEPEILKMLSRCSMEDIRLRFFAPMKEISHAFIARLTQIDYDREMALLATDPGASDILGVARIVADPDNEKAEYAVMVRSDLKGHGLGFQLMTEILAYARTRGIKHVFGHVLRENRTMLAMAQDLGFRIVPDVDDPQVVRVDCELAS